MTNKMMHGTRRSIILGSIYSNFPNGPFHFSAILMNFEYPFFLINSKHCIHFLKLYFSFPNLVPIFSQEENSAQSAQVSYSFSFIQHNLIIHLALLISLFPSSYPSLHPLQNPSIYGLQVLQYTPQQPMYITEFLLLLTFESFILSHSSTGVRILDT